jgi:hypothetical protein
MKGALQSAESEGKRAAKKVAYSDTMENLTRFGYGVKGVIYILMGYIAIQSALGKNATPADQLGAIAEINRAPYGEFLLGLVLIGLVSYALWGVIRAVLDPLHKGKDTRGLLTRAGYVVSAITYASFVYPTYELLAGTSGGTHNQTQKLVAAVLSMTLGRVIVGGVGLAVIGGGLYQIYLAVTYNFDQLFKTYALSPDERKFAIQAGRLGTIARGIVFAIAGFFVFLAALYARPNAAQGLKGALDFLARQPYGLWLLGIIAAGLILFGIYSVMTAIWFRLEKKQ